MSPYSKMAIFDMDNTLLHRSFIHTAAETLGFKENLLQIIAAGYPDVQRTKFIAQLLKGIKQQTLIDIAQSIPIVEDAAAVVAELKGKGYICGIISDSYTCITEHVKNRLKMHFSCSNVLEFADNIATGEVSIPHDFLRLHDGTCQHDYCKCNMMHHVRERFSIDTANILAVGDGMNDICMIRQAGIGIAFNATNEQVNEAADIIVAKRSFKPLLEVA